MVIYQPSTRILKQSTKNCSDTLHKLFNDGLRNVNFTDKLKCANTTPVSNKDDPKKQNQKKKKKDQEVLYQESRNILKDQCTSKCLH